jgi:hypothetical protein
MKTLVTAVALATLIAAPPFTQSAFAASDVWISLSLADIIAVLFFVPLALLFVDRLVRRKAVGADSAAAPDRYAQVVRALKLVALQPKHLVEGRSVDTAAGSNVTTSRSETSQDDRSSGDVRTRSPALTP